MYGFHQTYQLECPRSEPRLFVHTTREFFHKYQLDFLKLILILNGLWDLRKEITVMAIMTIRVKTATIVFKSISGLAPTCLSTLFTRNSTRDIVNLRNCETDLLAPRMKTSNGQKAFSFRGAKVWNGLKHEVKLAPSLSTFTCRLQCT